MNTGIIVKANKNLYTVEYNNKLFVCEQSGKIHRNNINPTVGDYIIFNDETLRIEELLPRKNSLIRPLISNIDKLIVIVSTSLPKFSSYLLDKFIIIASSNNIEPVIVFTKEDLLSFKEKMIINKYKNYYKKLGYSVYSNKQLNKIKKEFKSSIVALAGQTGAGKSTLLNKLDRTLKLATDEVSIALGRGKHTTRLVELYKLFGGLVADTPGFSSLEIGIKANEIKKYYREFNLECKYKTCIHIKEDGCKVKENLHRASDIYKERYSNYLKIVSEVEK